MFTGMQYCECAHVCACIRPREVVLLPLQWRYTYTDKHTFPLTHTHKRTHTCAHTHAHTHAHTRRGRWRETVRERERAKGTYLHPEKTPFRRSLKVETARTHATNSRVYVLIIGEKECPKLKGEVRHTPASRKRGVPKIPYI